MFKYWNVDFFRIIKINREWWWSLYWSSLHSCVATKRLECTRIQRLTTPSPSGQLSLSPERSSGCARRDFRLSFSMSAGSARMAWPQAFYQNIILQTARTAPKERQYLGPAKDKTAVKSRCVQGISSEDTYKLRRIKWCVIAAHRLTLVVHQELFKIPPGMCSQKHLFNG